MKSTNFILILICLSISPLVLNSQSLNDSIDSTGQKPQLKTKLILKWAPLSLIDIYSSVQFALECKIGGKSTVQAEAGYIFPINISESGIRDNYNNMRGYRLRTEYRYYLKLDKDSKGGFYIGPELFYIDIDFDKREAVRVPLNTFGDFYYQEMKYDVNKTVLGYHLKIGYQDFLKDWLVLDYYLGMGVRNVNIVSDEPSSGWEENENHFVYSSNERGKVQRFSASYGFKLGILLK